MSYKYSAVRITFNHRTDQEILQNDSLVFILQAIRPTREMGARKKQINKIKVIRALHQLFARNQINILQITEDHYKVLAKELRITHKGVKNVINKLQPIVRLQNQ